MKKRELYNLGISKGKAMELAHRVLRQFAKEGVSKKEMRERFTHLCRRPNEYTGDEKLGELASVLVEVEKARARFEERTEPAPYRSWGSDFDERSVEQIENACRLPVSVAGALMPDAHTGYGLPIGGVLATRNAVIPYAVGHGYCVPHEDDGARHAGFSHSW